MDHAYLNEHDANLGAQSRGEFLGMTGNSGWYLLGSAGVSIVCVLLFWGAFGISLLLCLLLGGVLCSFSVAYVFVLKNNRPEHYDTDFLEAALIEAGVLPLSFGPRLRRLADPFAGRSPEDPGSPACGRMASAVHPRRSSTGAAAAKTTRIAALAPAANATPDEKQQPTRDEPVVPIAAYEKLRDELVDAETRLDEALAETEEASS